jgi:hypothetical protein
VGALLWLLIPLVVGIAAGVWAWSTGRRNPSPPDRDIWEDLGRHQRMRSVLGGGAHYKAA